MSNPSLATIEELKQVISPQFSSFFVREHYEHAIPKTLTSADADTLFQSELGQTREIRGVWLYNYSANNATLTWVNGATCTLAAGAILPLPFLGAANFKYKSTTAGSAATILIWVWA